MKDRLINQTMRARSPSSTSTPGNALSVKGTSQCIATYFGATNYAKSNAGGVMQTRFHWIQSEKIHRPGANIHEKREAETMSKAMLKRRDEFIKYHQFEDMDHGTGLDVHSHEAHLGTRRVRRLPRAAALQHPSA